MTNKFSYVRKGSTLFTAPIIGRLVVVQRHCAEIFQSAIHVGRKMYKITAEFHLCLYVNYSFHYTDFQETCIVEQQEAEFSIPNFAEIGDKMWKLRVETHFLPSINCGPGENGGGEDA